MAKNKEVNLTASEKLLVNVEKWISSNLKTLAIICAAILVVVIAASVVTVVTSSSSSKSYEKLATLETKVTAYAESADAGTFAEIKSEAEALVSKPGVKNYPGAKAALILADIAFDEGDYAKAIDLYSKVAAAQSKTFLSQVALMSKAAALEETGDVSGALDVYNDLFVKYGVNGVYASRALFNAGRCYESLGRTADAIATYEQLVGEFGDYNSEFAALAETRISQLN